MGRLEDLLVELYAVYVSLVQSFGAVFAKVLFLQRALLSVSVSNCTHRAGLQLLGSISAAGTRLPLQQR